MFVLKWKFTTYLNLHGYNSYNNGMATTNIFPIEFVITEFEFSSFDNYSS